MNREETLITPRFFYLGLGFLYWVLASVLHLKISLFLIAPFASSSFVPARLIMPLCILFGAIFVVFQATRLLTGKITANVALLTALWFAAVLFSNRLFVSKPNEYIHYPQYAILSIFLYKALKRGPQDLPAARILFWATFLGMVDEGFQYFYICPSYGDYLDFNDFLLNQLGASGAILLLASGKKVASKGKKRISLGKTETVSASILLLSAGLLFWTGLVAVTPPKEVPPGGILKGEKGITIYLERRPGIMGSWERAQNSGSYYVLSPSEGTAAILMVFSLTILLEFAVGRKIG